MLPFSFSYPPEVTIKMQEKILITNIVEKVD